MCAKKSSKFEWHFTTRQNKSNFDNEVKLNPWPTQDGTEKLSQVRITNKREQPQNWTCFSSLRTALRLSSRQSPSNHADCCERVPFLPALDFSMRTTQNVCRLNDFPIHLDAKMDAKISLPKILPKQIQNEAPTEKRWLWNEQQMINTETRSTKLEQKDRVKQKFTMILLYSCTFIHTI